MLNRLLPDRFLLWRFKRQSVRRYAHTAMRFSPCWRLFRRPCVHCFVRQITGKNRRDKAAFIARARNAVGHAR